MAYPPPIIVGHGADNMKLVCYAVLPEDKRHTVMQSLAGPGPRQVCGLAICDAAEDGFYLFTCDADWYVMFDTNHESLEDALHQAEFEYNGIASRLRRL
ncbi:MAG: hypothetical protein QM754_12915 [Tepidisphaeraceae bacterium]